MKIHLFCFSLLSLLVVSTATDIIPISQSIRDGETLISAGGSFELGFFSPGASTKRYLGIWYNKISTLTVVWVANQTIPLLDSSGVLMLNNQGILVLLHHNKTIWFSNSSRPALNHPVAQLLESGNLVIRDGNDENPDDFFWKSFDYPSDTLLPGMKLGISTFTGQEWHLKAWQSADDPSQSNFTYWLDPQGFPQLILRKGSDVQFCSGPWNGVRFSGFPTIKTNVTNPIFTFHFVRNERETYYTYELINSSIVTRLTLNPNGILQRLIWFDRTREWRLYRATPADNCDNYAFCGAYGSCNIGDPLVCECMKGFVPKSQKEWDSADWSNGCVRRTPLNCLGGDGFIKYSGVKLPDSRYSWFNESMTLEECKLACLMNCSCMAYSSLDISTEGGSGCLLWFGDLINIREFTENGQEIYVRMAASELGHVGFNWKILVISLSMGMVLLALSLALHLWRKKKKKLTPQGERDEDLELPLYDIPTLANATNNFSDDNKVGQGGYGTVYKGMLENGQEIAVKRLSVNSTQGLSEFKTEVKYITKLQHRNLVTLHGCCIQEGEKMLIYEYCPNKSLDFYIFDRTRNILLDWPKRFIIINGTAHGILYLHRDSKLRIIHRDIKVDNILLDNEMNPKISDFGLARSFDGNETEANTSILVGTRGYISPEYALEGLYSEKSDVFSFGVLLLEVVSGKRNRSFRHPESGLNLFQHAWRLYTEDRSLELIDASIRDSCIEFEVLRSIHVGLLCVQPCREDRPSMLEVIVMLGSREGALSQPNQPGFFIERNRFEADSSSREHLLSSSREHVLCSINGLTITQLEGR